MSKPTLNIDQPMVEKIGASHVFLDFSMYRRKYAFSGTVREHQLPNLLQHSSWGLSHRRFRGMDIRE